MSLIYTSKSPDWIKDEPSVLTVEQAERQSIRPLRIGIINYMPDAALQATEQDFLRPIIEASGSHQFTAEFFSPSSVERSKETSGYIVSHYTEITREALAQCDLLIHTGANDLDENGKGIDFKNSAVAQEMIENYRLAEEAGVTTQVASCLASQVIAHNEYDISLSAPTSQKKITGVFPHEVTKEGEENFLTRNLNDRFSVVYSRNHRLNSAEISDSEKLVPLIVSTDDAGLEEKETHLFYDPEKLFFGFQGHPEYQKEAIYKEFLRDVGLYFKQPTVYKKFPNIPPNYFSPTGLVKIYLFKKETEEAVEKILKEEKNVARPQLDIDTKKEILFSWWDTADKIWARIFNATYQITGEKAGQKITTKRGIDELKHPLEALL